ncbi:Altered inheritance of mitochondria protein 6, partial [Ascosphaera pollenicola]
DQVNYAMSQLSGPLLATMTNWLGAQQTVSFPVFIAELENILNIDCLAQDAQRSLKSAQQNAPSEGVCQLYACLLPLFQDAELDESERLEYFVGAMHSPLARAVASSPCSTCVEMRDVAKWVEYFYGIIDTASPRTRNQNDRND